MSRLWHERLQPLDDENIQVGWPPRELQVMLDEPDALMCCRWFRFLTANPEVAVDLPPWYRCFCGMAVRFGDDALTRATIHLRWRGILVELSRFTAKCNSTSLTLLRGFNDDDVLVWNGGMATTVRDAVGGRREVATYCHWLAAWRVAPLPNGDCCLQLTNAVYRRQNFLLSVPAWEGPRTPIAAYFEPNSDLIVALRH